MAANTLESMSATTSCSTDDRHDCCVLCGLHGATVKLSSKGLSTLAAVSIKRDDDLHSKLSSSGDYSVHERCGKSYTATKNISQAIKNQSSAKLPSVPRVLRTLDSNFNNDTHCLICGKEIDVIKGRRYPAPYSAVSNIEYVDTPGKSSKIQTTLLQACSQRNVEKSVEIKARIASAGDIRAADAKYHRPCMQMFMSGRGGDAAINKINYDTVNSNAFSSLCNWLSSQQNSQFTVQDLQNKLATFLPEDVEPYSTKHLQRRLLEHFGTEMTIAEVDGRANIITFVDRAASILQSSYHEDEPDVDDTVKQASMLGHHIRKKLEDLKKTDNFYPSPQDTDIDQLENQVPDSLLAFVQGLMRRATSEKAIEKQRLEVISLCHALMQASAPNPYLSPLILSTGLFIHQTTRSRVLLDVLSRLGFSVSYDQVMDFEKSAVVSESVDDLPPGIDPQDKGGGFCQWVTDNFDYNEDTLTGHNTTHVMGIIACQTPASSQTIKIHRQRKTAAEIACAGDFGDILQPYRQSNKNLLSKVVFQKLEPITVGSLEEYLKMDTLWMLSNARFRVSPSWQGFMSEITHGEYLCSSIVYHPMIPLNPKTNEAVHSTMVFIDKQRKKAGQCCAMLTFDQALYAKAYKIKSDNPIEFRHVQLRLGGFHQLMSFLGSGCKTMEDCGLEDVWATVYARNSIPKATIKIMFVCPFPT